MSEASKEDIVKEALEAFEAILNEPGMSEGKAWQRYFDEHFPGGGDHGRVLWEDWRVKLVKDEPVVPALGHTASLNVDRAWRSGASSRLRRPHAPDCAWCTAEF